MLPALCVAFLVASAAPADTDPRATVEALLSRRDGAVSLEQWRAAGPRALPILEQIATDRTALSTRRGRAIEGLVALRSKHAPALLVKLAQAEDEPYLVRVSAFRGAGRLLSPARQVAALRPALEKAADVRLRIAAAEVLTQHHAGCAAVRAQSKREAAGEQPRFEAALARCASK